MSAMKIRDKDKQSRSKMVVDPRIDEIFAGKILSPEKLVQAKEFLAKYPSADKLEKKKS